MLKSCQTVVKKLSKSLQKVVKKLSKSCLKVVKKSSTSCQKSYKNNTFFSQADISVVKLAIRKRVSSGHRTHQGLSLTKNLKEFRGGRSRDFVTTNFQNFENFVQKS